MKSKYLSLRGKIFLVVLASAFFSSNAHACHWYDAVCKTKEAVEKAVNQAHDKANSIINDANSQANNIRNDAKNAADKARKDAQNSADNAIASANKSAEKIRSDAVKFVNNSALITDGIYKDLVASSVSVYAKSSASITKDYEAALKAGNALEYAAMEAAAREAAKLALAKNAAKLSALQTRITSLDKKGQATLNRLLRAIATGKIDEQSVADMKALATIVGFVVDAAGHAVTGNNIPGDIANSNFSVCLGDNAAYVGGAYASFCFALNLDPTLKKTEYRMALVENLGGSLGYGAGVGGSLAWGSGTIKSNLGTSVSLQEAYGPAGITIGWNVMHSASETFNSIPSFELGFGPGIPGATINAGGAFLIQSYL